ncbi:hypothetical protein [Sphingopyxis fribergensis]
MIINLPTYDALNATALKLYFRAWDSIISILLTFDESYQSEAPFDPAANDEWKEERAEYLEYAQENFHVALSAIQQCNELALKARIAQVSPYLLLLNSEIPFNSISKDVDFSNLRTIDAVDLPKAVNTICKTPLTQDFVFRYNALRSLRNQYAHLGKPNVVLNPVLMLNDMALQYWELWPERAWLKDRVDTGTDSLDGFFDGKHTSFRQYVMGNLEYERHFIPNKIFKKLFGVPKANLKFACHGCLDDWAISRNGPYASESKTAYYFSDDEMMHCTMCNEKFEAVARVCAEKECSAKFAAPPNAKVGSDACFGCAFTP